MIEYWGSELKSRPIHILYNSSLHYWQCLSNRRNMCAITSTMFGKKDLHISFLVCSDNDNKDGTMSFFAHAREYRSFLSWARMRTRKNSFAQVRIKKGKRKEL